MLTEVLRDQVIIRDEFRRVTGWCTLKLKDHVSWKHGPDCEIPASPDWVMRLGVLPTQPASATNPPQVEAQEAPATLLGD